LKADLCVDNYMQEIGNKLLKLLNDQDFKFRLPSHDNLQVKSLDDRLQLTIESRSFKLEFRNDYLKKRLMLLNA
jgi:hypothetical protein